jgi:hypothetical protein
VAQSTPDTAVMAAALAAGRAEIAVEQSDSWPALDGYAYHGLPGDIALALAPQTEADPAALLLTVLTAAGSAIGSGPHALAGGARHPARLNVLLVGETSRARKGTSWWTVAPVLRSADEEWFDRRVGGGLASGEGLIKAVSEEDRRLLALEPEFARVLIVAGRDGSTLSAILRDGWDSGNLRNRTRKDPMSVDGAHISVVGHITLEELRRRLVETETANGFANRILFGCVRRTRLLPSGGHPDPDEVAQLAHRLRAAVLTARTVGLVRRSDLAEKRWGEMYAEMADGPGGLLGAVTSRAEAQTLRLSVAYALLAGSRTVDEAHLEAAYAVWRYCEASARHIFGDALGDDVADRLLEGIRSAGRDGLDVSAQRDLFSRHVDTARLRLARAELVRRGLADERTEQTGGRPRLVLYPVAPKAFQAQKALRPALLPSHAANGDAPKGSAPTFERTAATPQS